MCLFKGRQAPYLVFLMFGSVVAREVGVDEEGARRVAPRVWGACVSLVASRRFGTGIEEGAEVATAARAGEEDDEEEGALGRLVGCT